VPRSEPALRPDRRGRCARRRCDVLRHPAVADKRFLITIGDRTVGGLQPPRPDGRPAGRCRWPIAR
jgi:phosphoribosylformylglycinamidine (FGAM) synthase-like enzyme